MSATIMDGKLVAQSIKAQCLEQAERLKEKGIVPKLAILRVGEKGPDLQYEKGARATMAEAGIETEVFALPADVSQEAYIETFRAINADPAVHGILALRPLEHIDENAAINAVIDPQKDVDACTGVNMGKLLLGDGTGLAPCTPAAVMEILDYYKVDVKGKDVVVIGNSNVVGKPLSILLTNRFATVTICHVFTKDVREACRRADIVISAAGVPNLVQPDQIRPGAVVIDVAINRVKELDENGNEVINEKTGRPKMKTVGDCAPGVEEVASMKTPVPGGVGTVTSSMLAKNLIAACKMQNGLV